MTNPSWRGYLHTWRDADRQADRTLGVEAALSMDALSSIAADRRARPGRGRLSGLREPLTWLSTRPAVPTADGRIVARPTRTSWGRDGAWVRFPVCRVGRGHWAAEEWLPSRGWVRLPQSCLAWPRKRHAVLPGMHPMWRRCGVEDLVPPVVAVRHLRAALVHWRPVEVEFRQAGISAVDLLPLLECAELGVRDGALQAVAWVSGADASGRHADGGEIPW